MPSTSRLAALLILVVAILPTDAAAYIDPHAGGVLFQILAPVVSLVVAVWFSMRRWIGARLRSLWHRVTGRRPQ